MSDESSPLEQLPEHVLRQEAARWQIARTGCPDPDLLLARGSELLEPDVRSALDEHLTTCTACRRLRADLESMTLDAPDAAVEAAVLARVRRGGSSSQFWRLPLAAALLVGCAASLAWWMRTPTSALVSVAPAAPAAPAVPVAMWTVEALPVRVPLSSVGVSRSASGSSASAALLDALAPYQVGRYADAIPALRDVARANPESGEAALYLGVSLLLADQPQDALAPLERAARQVDAARHAEVEWYRATAEQRAGQPAAARDRLQALCGAAGDYQQRACAAEQALR